MEVGNVCTRDGKCFQMLPAEVFPDAYLGPGSLMWRGARRGHGAGESTEGLGTVLRFSTTSQVRDAPAAALVELMGCVLQGQVQRQKREGQP